MSFGYGVAWTERYTIKCLRDVQNQFATGNVGARPVVSSIRAETEIIQQVREGPNQLPPAQLGNGGERPVAADTSMESSSEKSEDSAISSDSESDTESELESSDSSDSDFEPIVIAPNSRCFHGAGVASPPSTPTHARTVAIPRSPIRRAGKRTLQRDGVVGRVLFPDIPTRITKRVTKPTDTYRSSKYMHKKE